MREYGQIQCAFWQSADATSFTDAGKLLACYLMTGPHSNGIGCYRCPDGYVVEDLGWSYERVSEGFAELFRNGFAYRFAGVVFIPKFLAWNKVANGNVATARMAEFEALPKGEAKARVAAAILRHVKHLSADHRTVLQTVSETVVQTVPQTVTQTETNQDPTQPNHTQPRESSLRSDSEPEDDAETDSDDLLGGGNVSQHPGDRLVNIVLAAYHEILPKCQQVVVQNPKRLKRIREADKLAKQVCRTQGWRYDADAFWRAYFGQCLGDPWLRGEVANPRNASWRQNIDVLLEEDRFAKIMDRAVSGMEAAA